MLAPSWLDVEISLSEFGKYSLTLNGAAEHKVELGADELGNILRVENALTGMDRQHCKKPHPAEDWSAKRKTLAVSLKSRFRRRLSSLQKSARLIELNAELDMENNSLPEPVAEGKRG